ncbi:acetyl-CoA synthetase [Candidatus Bathyarchaeota archaeon]|nr:MAG: acetyl-CoA synthetase [Candidatus Bathyarchaeota archaeon]
MSNVDSKFRPLLQPKSVAVIGASNSPEKAGYIITANLLNYKNGKIYPVNPKISEVLGLKVYPSILDIPEDVDLAVVTVAAQNVPEILGECARKNVKFAIVVAQGFSDAGKEGEALQKKIDEIVMQTGLRVIGPNSMGIINASNSLITTFVPIPNLKVGDIALIAQTGVFCGAGLIWLLSFNFFGLSKSIDLGNKCDVDDAELLEYFLEDPDTRFIFIHMEGVKDGRRFFDVARKVSRKKPIIVLKGGRTDEGARVVASHTGSLAGLENVYNAAFKQAGILRVNNLEELLNLIQALKFSPLPKGDNVAILTFSGAFAALLTDLCVENGLKLAKLSDETLSKIRNLSPPYVNISNPVDIWPAVMVKGAENVYPVVIDALLNDPNVDSIIVFQGFSRFFPEFWGLNPRIILKHLDRVVEKPLILSTIGEPLTVDELNKVTKLFNEKGILFYQSIDVPIKVLNQLRQYKIYLDRVEQKEI